MWDRGKKILGYQFSKLIQGVQKYYKWSLLTTFTIEQGGTANIESKLLSSSSITYLPQFKNMQYKQ